MLREISVVLDVKRKTPHRPFTEYCLYGGIYGDKFVSRLFWGERQAQCLSIYFIAIQSWKFVIFLCVCLVHRRVLVLRRIFQFIWSLGFIVLRDFVLSFCFSFLPFVFMSFCHISLKIGLFAQSLYCIDFRLNS